MFLFFLFVLVFSNDEVLAGCRVNASPDAPLVFRENFSPPHHLKNEAYFEDGNVIIIKCLPGKSNKHIDENGDQAVCEGEGRVRIERTDVVLDLNSIICSEKNSFTVRKTNEECSTYGTKLEVGYEVLENFSSVYTVCFDEYYLTPLHINYTMTDMDRTNEISESLEFSDNGKLFPNIDIDNLFLTQNETLESLLLFDYITDENYLIPGQLIPLEMLLYTFHKYVTLDYVNVVLVWNSLYPLWVSLLSQLLSEMTSLTQKYEYEIKVGTLDVATLLDNQNRPTELHLKLPRQIPVPKYLYLQLEMLPNSKPTIFIFVNDPYREGKDLLGEVETLLHITTDSICIPANNNSENGVICINVTFKD